MGKTITGHWMLIAGLVVFLCVIAVLSAITYHPGHDASSAPSSGILIISNDTIKPDIDMLASAFRQKYGVDVSVVPSEDGLLLKSITVANISVIGRNISSGELPADIHQVTAAYNNTTKAPVVFVFRGEPSNDTAKFLYFTLGPEGQSLLANERLMPVYRSTGINDYGQSYTGDFYASYRFTAETTYQEIVVDRSMLYYTYFDISGINIDTNNLRQEPLWSNKDLKTVRANLSGSDVEGLIRLAGRVGFMGMNDTYGGAGPYQRYYPYTITIRYNGMEKTVIYQSYMGVLMPDQFKEVREYLRGLVKERLGEYGLYLTGDEVSDNSQAVPTSIPLATVPIILTHGNVTVKPITLQPVLITLAINPE